MVTYSLSSYLHFIEDHLLPDQVQYGVVHLLTGEVFRLSKKLRMFLHARYSHKQPLTEQEVAGPGFGLDLQRLKQRKFLVNDTVDELKEFANYLVVRPVQNPAITYRDAEHNMVFVRTSMDYYLFSPAPGDLPKVFEEGLPRDAVEIYLLADGTKTVRDMEQLVDAKSSGRFKELVDLLLRSDRQLIKFAPPNQRLDDPFSPHNTVPRNLHHANRWQPDRNEANKTVIDFHREGIDNSCWEFDWLEPTLNHAYRFPSEVLNGRSYASQFCLSALIENFVPLLKERDELKVLETGGGTGSFALDFNTQALALRSSTPSFPRLKYHIVELSTELLRSQQALLRDLSDSVTHFNQNAVLLDLAEKFDLILANEVIADFPVARVERASSEQTNQRRDDWKGPGALYIHKYQLPVADAPDEFHVHAGVFEFMERAWHHLNPGGTLILTEYGGDRYPRRLKHLNHDEWSIDFRQVVVCAASIGFRCQLVELKEFLGINDQVVMLDGSGEQIHCLNFVLSRFGRSLPYAAFSKNELNERVGDILDETHLVGITYSPLKSGFHYGPDPNQFKVFIGIKPR